MLQLNFSPFPYLKTKRLVLRQLIIADADAIAALRSNETVNKYLERVKTTSAEEALLFIDKINNSISNNQSIYWVIALQENNQLIGTICFWNIVAEDDTAEIGYELLPNYHGKGIMQEAITAVINFGFTKMKIKTITAFPLATNIASIKLLEKNDFKIDASEKYKEENEEAMKGYTVYVLGRNDDVVK
jgi:[ribosomal protein S5]-alanine N-acetyltransferase